MNQWLASLMILAGIHASAFASVTVPHREQCSGTLTAVAPGSLSFAGRGVATHFGQYTITGSNDFDDQGNVLNGQFTTVTSDGSSITGNFSGTYTLLSSGQVRFDVIVHWVAGSGRLAGVTGTADVVAILDGVTPGAAFEYETLGALTFP